MQILNLFSPKFIFTVWNLKLKFASLMGGKIVGARALVIRDQQVLLVRHTYVEGWCTIGGLVDKGETARLAIIRELKEEAGIVPLCDPTFMGVLYNNIRNRDDHVLFYYVTHFEEIEVPPSPEIAEKRWFHVDSLPHNTTIGTRRRIDEYLGKCEKTDFW